MVTLRLNTLTSRKRGGKKQTAKATPTSKTAKAKPTPKRNTSSKKSSKPDYANIAIEIHKNLYQAKLSPVKKVEQKALNYKLKQLLELPQKEFIAYMKQSFTKKDVRLLLELIILEQGRGEVFVRRKRKRWDSMVDSDDNKIYSELYLYLRHTTTKFYVSNTVMEVCQSIILLGVLYSDKLPFIKFPKLKIFLEDREVVSSLTSKEVLKLLITLSATYFFPKFKLNWIKEKKLGVITDSSIKKKIQEMRVKMNTQKKVKKQADK